MAPAGRPSLTAADLERLPLILYEIGANTWAIIDAWFRRAGLAPRPLMELGSVEAPEPGRLEVLQVRSPPGAAVQAERSFDRVRQRGTKAAARRSRGMAPRGMLAA